ncbi:MarR family winged helix-turn-helix transcriptional regulator [Streptomyces sp. NPDC013953]|uniref:MarR family winged helix-turn-helix transcriptional regulator n=1 Tax=Streptomyces sp. NPDC013953 TaxID=3364868 RepID=UPI0036F6227E
MDPADIELAEQPIGYWTKVAYEAVIGHIRGEMAELGTSQPQYWLLRHLSVHDLNPDGRGRTVAQLVAQMREFLRDGDDLEAESGRLVERGWLRRDDGGRLWITDAGETARVRIKEQAPRWRARLHDGVDDADYVTTLKVLRRMIENAGHVAV